MEAIRIQLKCDVLLQQVLDDRKVSEAFMPGRDLRKGKENMKTYTETAVSETGG
jgi:hypothetical protein